MQKFWLTADLHLSHRNIIRYCNRPFADVSEMNNTIFNNINSVVNRNDILYIVGDFGFCRGVDEFVKLNFLRNQIICKNVHLIMGNHDPHHKDYRPKKELFSIFSSVNNALLIAAPLPTGVRQGVYLHHYACRVWPHSHHGSWHCWGHSHGNLTDDPNSLSVDVGIDAVASRDGMKPENYRPLSFAEICEIMEVKIQNRETLC